MLRSLHNKLKISNLAACQTRTADFNSSSVETSHHGSLEFAVVVGVSGDTLSGSLHIQLELEHSDDNTNFSDCADADLSAAVTGSNTGTFAKIDDAAEDDAVYKVGYLGNKQYVRVVYNVTGTHTNGTPAAVVAIQGDAEVEPA
jgi:hypothetical protein